MNKLKVVLTRHENELEDLMKEYPFVEWIDFPLIQFDYQEIKAGDLDRIREEMDWLVFTSQNGVKSFFEQVSVSLLAEGSFKIACVGPKTAACVTAAGYEVSFIPSHFTSLTLAKELPLSPNESVCYVGGNLSSDETISVLRERARDFLQVESYHTVSTQHALSDWERMMALKPEIISFCSPSAVTSFAEQISSQGISASLAVRYAAIGSTTASAIKKELGRESILGVKHTFNSMIEAIVEEVISD